MQVLTVFGMPWQQGCRTSPGNFSHAMLSHVLWHSKQAWPAYSRFLGWLLANFSNYRKRLASAEAVTMQPSWTAAAPIAKEPQNGHGWRAGDGGAARAGVAFWADLRWRAGVGATRTRVGRLPRGAPSQCAACLRLEQPGPQASSRVPFSATLRAGAMASPVSANVPAQQRTRGWRCICHLSCVGCAGDGRCARGLPHGGRAGSGALGGQAACRPCRGRAGQRAARPSACTAVEHSADARRLAVSAAVF